MDERLDAWIDIDVHCPSFSLEAYIVICLGESRSAAHCLLMTLLAPKFSAHLCHLHNQTCWLNKKHIANCVVFVCRGFLTRVRPPIACYIIGYIYI